jgi:hypothetical protein
MCKPLVNLPIDDDDDDGEPLSAEPKRKTKPKSSKRPPPAAAFNFEAAWNEGAANDLESFSKALKLFTSKGDSK